MSGNNKVTLLDDLPRGSHQDRYAYFWAALEANPGKWAAWPGMKSSAHQAGKRRGYEVAMRQGTYYIRKPS